MKTKKWIVLTVIVFLLFGLLAAVPFQPQRSYHHDGLPATPDWSAHPTNSTHSFGYSLNSAGDVNGDGYDDLIVGDKYYSNGQSSEGSAWAFYGSETGLNASSDWLVESDSAGSRFGYAVDSAGDVNNDGYDDVIVGGNYYTANGQENQGKVWFYNGSSTGLSTTAGWSFQNNQGGSQFGTSVCALGDVNGDGYDDFGVGAPRFINTFGTSANGRIYVFLGSATGPGNSPAWIAQEGIQSHAYLGASCAGFDVNNDGYGDIAVGIPGYDTTLGVNGGKVNVYLSSGTGLSSTPVWSYEGSTDNYLGSSVSGGDIDGDGYDDLIVGLINNGSTGRAIMFRGNASGLSTVPDWSYMSGYPDDYLATENAIGGGDFNGDGHYDVALGARGANNPESDEGKAFIFYGSDAGLPSTPDWTYEVNVIDAYVGQPIKGIGDVNNDGADELGIGSLANSLSANKIYAFYGDPPTPTVTPSPTETVTPTATTVPDTAITGLEIIHPETIAAMTAGDWGCTYATGNNVTCDLKAVPYNTGVKQFTGESGQFTFDPNRWLVTLHAYNGTSDVWLSEIFTVE